MSWECIGKKFQLSVLSEGQPRIYIEPEYHVFSPSSEIIFSDDDIDKIEARPIIVEFRMDTKKELFCEAEELVRYAALGDKVSVQISMDDLAETHTQICSYCWIADTQVYFVCCLGQKKFEFLRKNLHQLALVKTAFYSVTLPSRIAKAEGSVSKAPTRDQLIDMEVPSLFTELPSIEFYYGRKFPDGDDYRIKYRAHFSDNV